MLQILIFLLFLFPLKLTANSFMAEKQCNLYEVDGEKHKKIGKAEVNKEYSLKEFKKINNRYYAIISDEKNSYLLNRYCGYQKFDSVPKLEPIFNIDKTKQTLDKIDDFDKEILNICGYFGSHPSRQKLGELLSSEKFSKNFNEIYEGLNKKIKNSENDKDIFLNDLLDVLFNNNGFAHSICGIVKENKMSGPHYYYRFLDLNNSGFIGINKLKNCHKYKENPEIENISLDFIDKNNQISSKCNNSFVKELDATNIIKIAGLTGKILDDETINKKISDDNERSDIKESHSMKSCIYKHKVDKEMLFKMVYNPDNKSLVTLYPISSDKCLSNNQDNEKCFCKFSDE